MDSVRASRMFKATVAGLALLAATGAAVATAPASSSPLRADCATGVVQVVQDVLHPVIGHDMHW